MDDLAGQFNGQTTQNSNALSRTLGGLKLVAGAANAVQEFDIRVWIETWAAPVLSQVVRLEQYYEHDETVLGLCGDRAQLFEKYGVSKITDDLIEQQVLVQVSVGLGAGDPQQRLMKFGQALQLVGPIVAQSPEFLRGEREINTEAICEEVFGAAGYRDGGARFFKDGQPKQGDPLLDLKRDKIKSDILKNQQTGKAALLTSIAALGKAMIGERDLENNVADMFLGRVMDATDMGHQHGHQHNQTTLDAMRAGHEHGMAIRQQGHAEAQPQVGPDGQLMGGAPDSGAPPASSVAPPAGGGATPGPSDATPPDAGASPSPQGGGSPPPTPTPTSNGVPTSMDVPLRHRRDAASGRQPADAPAGKVFRVPTRRAGPDRRHRGARAASHAGTGRASIRSPMPSAPAPMAGPPPMPPGAAKPPAPPRASPVPLPPFASPGA